MVDEVESQEAAGAGPAAGQCGRWSAMWLAAQTPLGPAGVQALSAFGYLISPNHSSSGKWITKAWTFDYSPSCTWTFSIRFWDHQLSFSPSSALHWKRRHSGDLEVSQSLAADSRGETGLTKMLRKTWKRAEKPIGGRVIKAGQEKLLISRAFNSLRGFFGAKD